MMSNENWEWIDHITDQMKERGITSEMIEEALDRPDDIHRRKITVLYIKK
ncbi:MAG: hypothetical protein GY940_38555 [bacterium]|nr:hypothetical protein [bacterium]